MITLTITQGFLLKIQNLRAPLGLLMLKANMDSIFENKIHRNRTAKLPLSVVFFSLFKARQLSAICIVIFINRRTSLTYFSLLPR